MIFFALVGLMVIFSWLVMGSLAADERKTKRAVGDQEELLKEFFDGSQTKVFTTPGNWLPISTMIENAHRFGYTLTSQSSDKYTKTLVFEKD